MGIFNFNNIEIAQIIVSIFFSIVFFQSSFDKINDREGNLIFFNQHFKGTIFKNYTSISLTFLALLEIFSAFLCFLGVFYKILYFDSIFIFYGLLMSAIVLLSLLLGQRIAKDYVGAADITIYFILCVITILSF
tara:strand:- start:281 stop:682 length:402 start_codon:yes stop_codon:yes gene_type:complete